MKVGWVYAEKNVFENGTFYDFIFFFFSFFSFFNIDAPAA